MRLLGSIVLATAVLTACPTAEAHHYHRSHHSHRHHRPVRFGSTRAVHVAMRYLGRRNPTGSRGPWCGDFMNFVEHKVGHQGVQSRKARTWAHYGHPSAPIAGSIAVFRGHVGLVVDRVGNRIKIISGNYSHRVAEGYYSIRSAIAFRMP